MARIEESIDVQVPVETAYNQWTQFEEFPQFMEGIEQVQQVDDTHLRWVAEVGGKREEWDAEITEQHPDHRVAWKATSGKGNAGVVTFHRIDESRRASWCRWTGSPRASPRRSAPRSAWTAAACRATCSASRS